MTTPAPCLLDLRAQLEVEHPSAAPWYYGIMGDRAHRLRRSAHNRGNAIDIPTALGGLFRTNQIVEALRYQAAHGREPRVKLLIWARRYCSANTNWQWRRYRGINPHEWHAHVEVHEAARLNRARWLLT